jgi:tRNA modification GTPase
MSVPSHAILLTPPGAAAIAVVRLSGERVEPFLAARFSRRPAINRAVHGDLTDESGNVLDDAVVVLTRNVEGGGGGVADVNLHGGPWVVQSVLDLVRRAGFELRRPTELADVAFDATTLSQREVVESLPLARTELALQTLLAQPRAWSDAKPTLTRDDLQRVLADRSLEHQLHPPRVSIVGGPNVGNSTLANQLFAQERSITADLPGTTRDWVGEVANVDGLSVLLVDIPGVRDTPDAIERQAIARSGEQVAAADLVLLVLDATRPLDPEQSPLIGRYGSDPRTLVVLNKADLAGDTRWGDAMPRVDVRTCAVTGQGVDALRAAIQLRFGCADVALDRPRVWTERQRDLVRRSLHDAQSLAEL